MSRALSDRRYVSNDAAMFRQKIYFEKKIDSPRLNRRHKPDFQIQCLRLMKIYNEDKSIFTMRYETGKILPRLAYSLWVILYLSYEKFFTRTDRLRERGFLEARELLYPTVN